MISYREIDGSPLLHKRQVSQLGDHFYQLGEAIKLIDNRSEYYKRKLKLIELEDKQ